MTARTTSGLKSLHDQAIAALNRGDMRTVAHCSEAILRQDSGFADAWFLNSVAAEARRDLRKAIESADRAIALEAANPEYRVQKAKLHSLVNQGDLAAASAEAAVALKPRSAIALDTLGVVFTRLGRYEEARALMQRAIERQPDNAQFHFNLASAEQILGNQADAEHHFRRAIALRPGFARAYWALSEHRKNGPADDGLLQAIQALQQQSGRSVEERLYLAHAASRELEHRGDFAGAFAQLVAGKSRRLAQLDYRVEDDERLFRAMTRAFPVGAAGDHEPRAAAEGAGLLFIVGMPRSGTTLLEQILASHRDIASLGELQAMTHAVKRCSATRSRQTLDETVIERALAAPPGCVAQHYTGAVRGRLAAEQTVPDAPAPRYVIDKMPLNFLYLGFILRSLPAAKVICVRRHPLDTILSNFRQLFAVNFSYYNYHYDLGNTTRYYILFHRLMQHWLEVFGDRILEVAYESITAEPDATLHSALAYLDLPPDDDCLRFHERKTAVATASAVQVREPIYRTAVGRWEAYAQQLAPAMALLESARISLTAGGE